MARDVLGARRTFDLVPRGPEGAPARIGLAAACGGELVGAIVDGAVRTWLAQEHGQLVLMMWPPTFRARFDPLELLDAQGRVIARGGEFVTAGGGFLVKEPDPRKLGHERAFAASTVTRGRPRR